MKYEIEFTHLEKRTFTTTIEADNEAEARVLFRNDPYGAGTDPEEKDCQGISIDLIYIREE